MRKKEQFFFTLQFELINVKKNDENRKISVNKHQMFQAKIINGLKRLVGKSLMINRVFSWSQISYHQILINCRKKKC